MGLERKDFLKKQIDQLGRVLGKMLADMLGLKHQGKVSESLQLADQSLQEAFTLNFKRLVAIAPKELIGKLQQEFNLQPQHLEPMADVLYAAADSFSLQQDLETANALWERALVIYEHLEAEETTFSFERRFKIDQLKTLLKQ